ncbi:MAG: hypothetical protein V4717_00565 [Bacteroidota bacterium]
MKKLFTWFVLRALQIKEIKNIKTLPGNRKEKGYVLTTTRQSGIANWLATIGSISITITFLYPSLKKNFLFSPTESTSFLLVTIGLSFLLTGCLFKVVQGKKQE